MSIFSKLFAAIKKPERTTQSTVDLKNSIPTIKFDSSLVSDAVKADIRKNVELLEGIDPKYFDQIYDAAMRSVETGRDLYLLTNALMQMNIPDMTKQKAGKIAILLNNKATSMIDRERQLSLGITEAIWMYSGRDCEGQQDLSHVAANGKRYKISEGMFLDGEWTWPGSNEGCRCSSRIVLPLD